MSRERERLWGDAEPTTARRGVTRRDAVATLASAGPLTVAGCQGLSIVRDVEPHVAAPRRSVTGSPFPVRLSQFPADTAVRVTASATDARGEQFGATADVRTDSDGEARASHALRRSASAPFATRTEASSPTAIASGTGGDGPVRMLFHHMTAEDDPAPPNFLRTTEFSSAPGITPSRYRIRIEASVDGETVASTAVARIVVAEDVTVQRIRHDDLVGWLYDPPGEDPAPGVIALHGSSARAKHDHARLLATYGYPTVALQWLPSDEYDVPFPLKDIPVEYFGRAARWLTDRERVVDGKLGVTGISLGAAASVLTGMAFDGRAVVVPFAGGALLQHVFNDDDPVRFERDGAPLVTHGEVRQDSQKSMVLPAETIDGPILLLTGRDDGLWSSFLRAEGTARRLSRRDHPHPHAHVTYDGAGHVFDEPYVDYASYEANSSFTMGGTPSGDARAAADAWLRLLEYFEEGLGTGSTGGAASSEGGAAE